MVKDRKVIGTWIYSEGVTLTTQGFVCISGGSKAEEKYGDQITKPFICHAKGFGLHP